MGDCHICGRYSGAACSRCNRPTCSKHLRKELGRWVCSVCLKLSQERLAQQSRTDSLAQWGRCTCGLPLVKEDDSTPYATPKCPIHVYGRPS